MKSPHRPEVNIPGAEILSDNPRLEKAVQLALAATVLAGIHHHFSRNGKGYAYLRPSSDGKFDFEIGLTDFVEGKLERIRALFGRVSVPGGDIDKISDSKLSELSELENPDGIAAKEIDEAFEQDSEDL